MLKQGKNYLILNLTAATSFKAKRTGQQKPRSKCY